MESKLEHTLNLGFQDFHQDDLFSDTELIFSDGQSVKSHKLILAACSPYLRKYLKANENTEEILTIILPDFDIQDFRQLLPYLYGFAQPNQSLSNELIQTLRFGHFEENSNLSILSSIPPKQTNCELKETIFEEPYDLWDLDEEVPSTNEPSEKPKALDLICLGCFVPMTNIEELRTHAALHQRCAEKNCFCPQCDKVFDSPIKVTRHSVVHKKDYAKYPCDKCPKTFKSSRILQTHLSKVHNFHQLKRFQCMKCPKSFDFENHLKHHLNNHDIKTKELYCDQCDMICSNRSSLNYHMQKHLKSNYDCDQCSKSFKSEFGLKYHLKVHNNQTDFMCHECGKGFITKYKLIHHRRSKHTNERPYVCEECGEGFVRNDKLTVHKRRAHTGERPYPCEQCDWRGVDSSSLIHHRKKHKLKAELNKNLNSIVVDESIIPDSSSLKI
eukprot:13381.XXX_480632_481957_1 [CDS] Oithona nana genome sequencing.